MEKSLHERLRGIARLIDGDYSSQRAVDTLAKELGTYEFNKDYGMKLEESIERIADEIESEYVTKAQNDSEVKAIVEAQKGLDGSTYSAEYVIKTWADHNGMPMRKDECITEWLDRWFIKRPRFEDGEPLKNDDKIDYEGETVTVIDYLISSSAWTNMFGMTFQWVTLHLNDGRSVNVLLEEQLKRPTYKVYDADGVEIKVGDTVWFITKNDAHLDWIVNEIVDGRIELERGTGSWSVNNPPEVLTHERPVFDAEGVRICKGDTVWTKAGIKREVAKVGTEPCEGMEEWDGIPWVMFTNGSWMHAKDVTHREPDTIAKVQQFASEWAHFDNVSNSAAGDYRDAMQEVADRLTALIERGA